MVRFPARRRNLRLSFVILLLSLTILFSVDLVGGKRWFKNQNDVEKHQTKEDSKVLEYERDETLVDKIGKAIYQKLNSPKYKFYLFMTVGTLSEEVAILVVSSICNVLYGLSILFGFLYFPRNRMLIITALTLYIGPAIVLFFIGALALMIASFALYPIQSVVAVWVWFFLTSHLAQSLGKQLGLDSDRDGGVDVLDLLHYLGNSKVGKQLRLDKLHTYLSTVSLDPFQDIKDKLDQVAEMIIEKLNVVVINSPHGATNSKDDFNLDSRKLG